MLEWAREFLWDKAAFFASLRYCVAVAGVAIDKGWLPTGIDHGDQFGLLISAAALLNKGKPRPVSS